MYEAEKLRKLQEETGDGEEEATTTLKKEQVPQPRRTLFSFMKKEEGSGTERGNFHRFEDGISFRGKLIGVERVDCNRGQDVCQKAIQRLKAAVKILGEHKQRIEFSVSFKGVKIRDEKSGELMYMSQLTSISFICQDTSDPRAFGYIYRNDDGEHYCIAIKTEKTSVQAVRAFEELFEAAKTFMQEKEEGNKETGEEPDATKEEEDQEEADGNLLILMDDPDDQLEEEFTKLAVSGITSAEEKNETFDPFDTSFISLGASSDLSTLPEPLVFQEALPFKVSSPLEGFQSQGMDSLQAPRDNPFFNMPTPTSPTRAQPNPFAQKAPQKPPRVVSKNADPFADLDPLNKGDYKSAHFDVKMDSVKVSKRDVLFVPPASVLSTSLPFSNSLNPFRTSTTAESFYARPQAGTALQSQNPFGDSFCWWEK